ncbi:MAG TPA: CocE/NonD family hydrolase [Polyangiaceae bacterium]
MAAAVGRKYARVALFHRGRAFADLEARKGLNYVRAVSGWGSADPPAAGGQRPSVARATTAPVTWLVENVLESNGNGGILGTSYDGFTAAMALYEPHPALKVAVPMNPMVDGWHGDDWFRRRAAGFAHDCATSRTDPRRGSPCRT